MKFLTILACIVMIIISDLLEATDSNFKRVEYNNPGLEVDLGVGLWAWPLPMDYDGDGDYDLVISCPDVPYNGTYFFENPEGDIKMPVFKPGVRVGTGFRNIQPSFVGDKTRLLILAYELINFRETSFEKTAPIYPTAEFHPGKIRANQWKYVDYDGDADLDLIVGIGDWADYGWDNAFDSTGRWLNGPLHGFVYLIKNNGTSYADPEKINAHDKPIDVFGMPSPNFADFDGDGDLDLICGEFLDKFTYFENIGSRTMPEYAEGQYLLYQAQPITMDLEMIVPVGIDWDKDGDVDLVVGQEDGRVALVENTGLIVDGLPQFLPSKFFRQKAAEVKFGALITPFSYDWDDDGDEDLICGNTAGYIGFIENLNGNDPPGWAEPKYLTADGTLIRIQAGYNGSIQGPCEAKWGYTTLNVADWNHDGLPDIIINSIWGKVLWFRNIGTHQMPELTAAEPIEVDWAGKTPKPIWNWWQPEAKNLVTQWRTTPVVYDVNQDGLNDLVMLDHEGYLAFFQRIKKDGELKLLPGKQIFFAEGPSIFNSKHSPQNEEAGPLRLNAGIAGKSGRRKFCLVDWDRDGRFDLIVNSQNVNFLRQISVTEDRYIFQDMGMLDSRILAGHTTSPTVVDWNKDGTPDLLVGAEDGCLYYLKNPNTTEK